MTGQIITDGRTLRAMVRAGFILCEAGHTDRHWTGLRAKRRFVAAGPRLETWYQEFQHNGGRYRLTYVDGCFYPFVMRLDTTIRTSDFFV